jgi:hypothetical protein
MKADDTTLKCSEVSVKEPKTWAWIAAVVTSLLLFFVSFSVVNSQCGLDTSCAGTFVFALLLGLLLLCVTFLCVLRCCECSSKVATKVTPYTQNYWFKGGLYTGCVVARHASQCGRLDAPLSVCMCGGPQQHRCINGTLVLRTVGSATASFALRVSY